ncbi:DNA translocase FtsK 4TM domain-containing protein, partial [Telmatospirillum sp. J64-1]|uniref:DNA translocase FtsK 4TM domain-containing protein n=1 Tax=Telmatospirillum sp. J64-1 TaxID=2502183 RepID=UPI00163DD905
MAARSTARPSQTRSSSSRSRSPRKGTPKGSFLPPGALPLLQRRLKQAAGLAVVTLALLLVLALLTYTEGDPSLNAAGSEEVGNLMGPFGAVISDLLLQSVGGAAMLVAVVMVAWGGRLMTSATAVSRLWMRLLTLLAAVLMGAVALQALPAANEMALPAGLGGAAGTLLLERLAALPHVLGLSAAPLETAAALTAAALTALLTAHAMGLSWQEWVATGRSLRRAGSAVGEGGVRLGRAGGEMLSSLRDRREPSLGAPEDGESAPASPKQRRPSPSAAAPAARPARQAPADLVEAPAPRAQPARRDAPRESLP